MIQSASPRSTLSRGVTIRRRAGLGSDLHVRPAGCCRCCPAPPHPALQGPAAHRLWPGARGPGLEARGARRRGWSKRRPPPDPQPRNFYEREFVAYGAPSQQWADILAGPRRGVQWGIRAIHPQRCPRPHRASPLHSIRTPFFANPFSRALIRETLRDLLGPWRAFQDLPVTSLPLAALLVLGDHLSRQRAGYGRQAATRVASGTRWRAGTRSAGRQCGCPAPGRNPASRTMAAAPHH